MGPGCFYPGNPTSAWRKTCTTMLQWGRDVSIPEMAIHRGSGVTGVMASMGPGCFYPGNERFDWGAAPKEPLQWGRDVSIPEITWRVHARVSISPLQWGRDVSIPEMRSTLHSIPESGRASMGPGCFYPGNL